MIAMFYAMGLATLSLALAWALRRFNRLAALLLPPIALLAYVSTVIMIDRANAASCARATALALPLDGDRARLSGTTIRLNDSYCLENMCRNAIEKFGARIILPVPPAIWEGREWMVRPTARPVEGASWVLLEPPVAKAACGDWQALELFAFADRGSCPVVSLLPRPQPQRFRYLVTEHAVEDFSRTELKSSEHFEKVGQSSREMPASASITSHGH